MEMQDSNELAHIAEFIKQVPPFNELSQPQVSAMCKKVQIQYVRKNQPMPPEGENDKLFIIKKGALAYFDEEDTLLSKYSEGDLCSVFILPDKFLPIRVTTEEDSLLYSIQKKDLFDCVRNNQEAASFFSQTAAQRLKRRMEKVNKEAVLSATLLNTQVETFYHANVAAITANTSIRQTAIKMSQLGHSCLVVTEHSNMVGIVTDKDIHRRCVAQGLNTELPVSEIMSEDVLTIDAEANSYDALITMTSRNLHHLPVTKDGELSGMLTVTDLMNHEGQNAVNIVHLIKRAQSIKELAELARMLPKLQIRMAKLGTTADHVGKSISAITMAFTIRLIKMAENLLGPAPIPFAWLAAGSQGRQEQFCHSDQDNALILDDAYEAQHEMYFHDLATFVCDGLAACGFVYCPGDIMATNRKWRQPQKIWHKYFKDWIETPEPQALLNASVFFDLTTVYGDESLLAQVRRRMLEKTKSNSLFIAHLSRNALMLKPPLGFFRDFVLVSHGDNAKTLDLKHNGMTPIVDLARIYALSLGCEEVNTIKRLRAVAGTQYLSESSALNLKDAFEFLGHLRLQHQAAQMAKGKKPDNFMPPKAISRLEREHLKDAFKVIKTLQNNRQVTY